MSKKRALKIILFVFVFSGLISARAQVSLSVFPGYKTAGYYVTCNSGIDKDHNAKVKVYYREDADSKWHSSLDPDYCFIKSPAEFRGSLFQLKSKELYHIRIEFVDSFPTIIKKTIEDTFSLKNEAYFRNNSTLKWVSPTGSGTSYSQVSPGDLKTLIQSGTLGCDMTVILKGGTYFTGEMQLNFNKACTEGTPLQFSAAPGETVVLDGGDTILNTWKKVPGDTNMFYATINPNLEYNQLCVMGGERLYPYAFKTPNATFPNYPSLSNLGYDLSGFYRLGNLVYIKTLDHKNPKDYKVTFSKYFYALNVNGNNKQNHILIQNIQFKNYAKGKVDKDIFSNPSTSYPGFCIAFNDANKVTVNNCKFEYCNSVLTYNGKCTHNMISGCTFVDGMAKWSHGAFKQTRDQVILDYGSYGRYLEYAAVMVNSGDSVFSGNCLKNNTCSGIIGGLIGEVNGAKGGIKETEILNNKILWCYNGINADAVSVNTRLIGNEISHCQVGLSFIGAEGGPNYAIRNIIHHINEKKNHNDIFFMDCNNKLSSKIWGTGLKMNATALTANPPAMHFYHNTFHSKDTLGFPLYLWGSTWKKMFCVNNIYYSEGLSSIFLDGIKDDTNYVWNSKADHFYNKQNNIAIIQAVNGQIPCYSYSDPMLFGAAVKNISTCKEVSFSASLSSDPQFTNADANDFQLKNTSPDVDKGSLIFGVNDGFYGSAPDIGAIEFGFLNSINLPKHKNLFVYPNPSDKLIFLPKEIHAISINIVDITGKKVQNYSQNQGAISIENVLDGIYFMSIETADGIFNAKFIVHHNK